MSAHGRGRIDIITGCMFSGKTSRLIHRLKRAGAAGQPISAFKHHLDRRYSSTQIVSHDGRRWSAQAVVGGAELLARCNGARVVGIDEGQFFDRGLVAACATLRDQGRWVILAGLNLDCRGRPFWPMDEIAAIADDVLLARATCSVCRAKAEYTYRKAPVVADADMVGGSEMYEPRCETCFRLAQTAASV